MYVVTMINLHKKTTNSYNDQLTKKSNKNRCFFNTLVIQHDSTTGNIIYSKYWPTNDQQNQIGVMDAQTDPMGNLFVLGYTLVTPPSIPGDPLAIITKIRQGLVYKFDANNVLQWAQYFNVSNTESSTTDECYYDSKNDAVIAMGSFYTTLTVPGFQQLRVDGEDEMSKFIVKFSSSTGQLNWIYDLSCLEANGAIDTLGNFYMTGINKTDMFIEKRNGQGRTLWHKDIAGVKDTNSFVFGRDIDINLSDKSIVVLATASGTVQLDTDITFSAQNPFVIAMRLRENCTCSDPNVRSSNAHFFCLSKKKIFCLQRTL